MLLDCGSGGMNILDSLPHQQSNNASSTVQSTAQRIAADVAIGARFWCYCGSTMNSASGGAITAFSTACFTCGIQS
jgi:hypothetical protein